MIPDANKVDPDLIKMFADVPNQAIKQSNTQHVINVTNTPEESARSVWDNNTNNLLSFNYGYMCGSIGDSLTKPTTKSFFNDLLKGLKQCLANETDKIDPSDRNTDFFMALQHMFNILIQKYEHMEITNNKKIDTNAIIASFHGFITSYILTHYKNQLKK